MAKFSAEIDLNEITQKLDLLHEGIAKLGQLIANKVAKDADALKPIPQKAAMKDLEVSFPTFKKLCAEFRVKPIKRNGRLFYKPNDIARILNGQK